MNMQFGGQGNLKKLESKESFLENFKPPPEVDESVDVDYLVCVKSKF